MGHAHGPCIFNGCGRSDTIVHCYSVMSEGIPGRFVNNEAKITEWLLNKGRLVKKMARLLQLFASKGGRPQKSLDTDSIHHLIESKEIDPRQLSIDSCYPCD